MYLNDSESIWSQKFRPRKIQDCIIPERIKKIFLSISETGKLSNHLLLASKNSGIGKTTIALALCEELQADYLMINASCDANLDLLREKARSHAATMSFTGAQKIIIWDEADAMRKDTQEALRAFIEEYSSNCCHIFTANDKNKIIPAIKSRCTEIDFSITGDESIKLKAKFFKRIVQILESESVEFDRKTVAEVIESGFPDFRNILDFLRFNSISGKLEHDVKYNNTHEIVELINILKSKEFNNMRKWIIDHSQFDYQYVINALYDKSSEFLKGEGISELILLLSEYQDKRFPFSANPEITLAAMLTEIMIIENWIE